jgi:hypothetical protein
VGGVVVFGVRNNGNPADDFDPSEVLALDPARIGDQVHKYTGSHFSEFQLHDVQRGAKTVAAMIIGATDAPLVFARAGTYRKASGKEVSAFQTGTFYVRHGAKSEPATTEDLEKFIERRLETVRRAGLGGIRKVITAPGDSEVMVYRTTERDEEGRAKTIRVTDDPEAAVFGRVDANVTHPYRQTEVVAEVNKRLKGKEIANPSWIQAVRKAHGIGASSHPLFCYKPRWSSQQYSDAFVDWMVKEYRRDSDFFQIARQKAYEMRRAGR